MKRNAISTRSGYRSNFHRLLSGMLWMSGLWGGVSFAEHDPSSPPTPESGVLERKSLPVLAVVPSHQEGLAPVTAFLEYELTQKKACSLVDRTEIDKVFREAEIQTLAGAEAVSQRSALGKQVGADVLVLLSMKTEPQPRYEVVVSETAGGLRLGQFLLPVVDDPEGTARKIATLIDTPLQKATEPLKRVCAVPPFTSHDFSRELDYLQGAYASLLERLLLKQSGIRVVEIAEARALSDELALTGKRVERQLPVYVKGEYRFETSNPSRQPFLKLTLTKGDEILGTREASGLPQEEALPFLQTSVQELLGLKPEKNHRNLDLQQEHQTLSNMAKERFAMGQYEEAAQMAEASLLLKPDQPEIHHLAMSAYGRSGTRLEQDIPNALPSFNRAMVHLEHFLRQRHFNGSDVPVFNSISQAFGPTVYMTNNADRETAEAVYVHRRRMRTMYVGVIRHKHDRGTLNDSFLNMIFTRWLFEHQMYNETLRDNLAKRLSVVPMLLGPGVRNPERYLRELVRFGLTEHTKKTQIEDYTWFLNRLETFDHPDVKDLVANERKRLTVVASSPPRRHVWPTPTATPELSGPAEVAFSPIQFMDERGTPLRSFKLEGIMPCGNGVDLVWGHHATRKQVYLMERPGHLRMIATLGGHHSFGQAAFDGTYAWIPVRGPESMVLAIHPATGSVVRFIREDGVPAFEWAASASIGRGRLCLAGAFGPQTGRRAFVAVLEISDDQVKKVRTIHEATRQLMPDRPAREQFQNPDLSFVPKFMVSVPGVTEGTTRVLLGRSLPGSQGLYPTMLIDPDGADVHVMTTQLESHIILRYVSFHEHNVYYTTRRGLRRIGIDSPDRDAVRELPEEGSVFFYEDQFHLVGIDWWTARDVMAPFHKRRVHLPKGRPRKHRFFSSSHYGLIFLQTVGSKQPFQVTFPRSR